MQESDESADERVHANAHDEDEDDSEADSEDGYAEEGRSRNKRKKTKRKGRGNQDSMEDVGYQRFSNRTRGAADYTLFDKDIDEEIGWDSEEEERAKKAKKAAYVIPEEGLFYLFLISYKCFLLFER